MYVVLQTREIHNHVTLVNLLSYAISSTLGTVLLIYGQSDATGSDVLPPARWPPEKFRCNCTSPTSLYFSRPVVHCTTIIIKVLSCLLCRHHTFFAFSVTGSMPKWNTMTFLEKSSEHAVHEIRFSSRSLIVSAGMSSTVFVCEQGVRVCSCACVPLLVGS